ncbi:MAG: transcription-repair coupling factor [Rhodothermales bacterium]|nr:transcription-repair coupling factor [Rhodothermales bacterium]MBO6778853.1 transcription-repair coupling factor [Rhodothermales bacterium]
MSLGQSYDSIRESEAAAALRDWAADAGGGVVEVRGAAGSSLAFLLSDMVRQGHSLLCVLPDHDRAAYLTSDLQQVLKGDQQVQLLPPGDHRPFDPEHVPDPAPAIERADVLERMREGWQGAMVTAVEAFLEKVPDSSALADSTISLKSGDSLPPEALIERLVGAGFDRVEFVEQPGELALRGGILDVFPYVGDYPVRLEYFGDEIDSIREFDIHTQRSVSRLTTARLVPNLDASEHGERSPVSAYLSDDTLIVLVDPAETVEKAEALWADWVSDYDALDEQSRPRDPGYWYLDPVAFERTTLDYRRIITGAFLTERGEQVVNLAAQPQPTFNGSLAEVRKRLARNSRNGLNTTILCDSRGQEARLLELLDKDLEQFGVRVVVESLHEGFEIPDLGIALYTDHQIFNRYHRPTSRKATSKFGGISLRELQQLTPGDFVVHVDYGIGRFAGMEQIEVRGKKQEAVRLVYHNGDVLYVNVSALHKLHKYKGKEGHQPQLTKLGSGQWEKKKARTKRRVKDIARDLIKLYAKRKRSDGYAFASDSIWQRELEASFEFEDTPDQALAAEAVKTDMEDAQPMDRLVCGDVGFGKTEVAVRAAFKAVQDGKQVAVLVPTTILAAQHERTFRKRLRQFPVRIEQLSRFKSSAEQKEVLGRLAEGKVDIIVGTHRLISKDVKFKDLGLLIVDEEQRFGVGAKEKLRELRVSVDTLTLTATPIPRTLQFSLMGARDLSIIATAPPNRQPIVTEIHTFSKDLIRGAILYETGRGGQVFFIHNRVQSIYEVSDMIRSIIPDIRIVVGHGQMKGQELERVMKQFVSGKADVLVSTSIIENGLDIGNANTIIIDRASHFGLAELHQLRGRVGRSDRKAFCYLLVPSIHGLTREAKQRLQAVEEFSDLGSGFQLAMRDLDIRGAGNLLGAEQSGVIEDVGFETYHRILDEAVAELRREEFGELFGEQEAPRVGETTVEVEVDAFIPDEYLSNRVERLNIYRRIAEADSEQALKAIREELEDRFGPVLEATEGLFRSASIKLLGERLRLPRVVFKNERLFLSVPDDKADPHFYEHIFQPLLQALDGLDRRVALKESRSGRLRAIVQDVPDLDAAMEILRELDRSALPASSA